MSRRFARDITFNRILHKMRLSNLHFLVLLLCTACEPRQPADHTAPAGHWHDRVDTLLAHANQFPPDVLLDSVRVLPDQYVDSFYRQYLFEAYRITDVANLTQGLRQYEALRARQPGVTGVGDYFRGVLHQWAARYDSAEHYYAKANELLEQTRDTTALLYLLSSRSGNFGIQGRLDEDIALKYRLLGMARDSGVILANRSMLANVLNKKEDYDKALALIPESALQTFEEQRDTIGWAYALTMIGNAHFGKKEYTEAQRYLSRALELRRSAHHMPPGMVCEAYYLYGRCLSRFERWQEALDTLRVAERISEQMPNRQGLIILQQTLGEVLYQLGRPAEAEVYLQTSLTVSKARKQAGTPAAAAANLLYRINKDQRQTALALDFLEQYVALKDTQYNQEKDKVSRELVVRYETREKEARIAALQQENHLATQRNWWIGGSCVLLGVLGLFWMRTRARKKQEQMKRKLEQQRIELEHNKAALQEYAQMLLERNARIAEMSAAYKTPSHPAKQPEGAETDEPLYDLNFFSENDWVQFQQRFNRAYPGFLADLKRQMPNLTTGETRLILLTKMSLNIKESAIILGISPASVRQGRYRLRKKIQELNLDIFELTAD
jgi:tetratricopeptide (TPR) repeat protein